jgi:hypothetical protein
MRIIVLSIAFITLLGCASTKEEFVFNGSSEESIQGDISYMLKKLPNRKRMEFAAALLAIQFSDVRSVYDILGDPTMEEMNYFILSKKMDGLTYKQVMALASDSPTKISVDI